MLISYFGPNNYYFYDAFFDYLDGGAPDVELVSASATQIVLARIGSPQVTTFTGTGFQLPPNSAPTAGTITGMEFRDNGALVAEFAEIAWPLVTLDQALGSGFNAQALGALVPQSPVALDARDAVGPLDMDDFERLAPFITGRMTVTATPGDDEVTGGEGDDMINPGANLGYDRIHATPGSDTYDFSDATDASYYEIEYDRVAGPVSVTGATDSLSVTGAFGTDSFTNINRALRATEGGVGVIGSTGNDVFSIIQTSENKFALSGGAGNDIFNLDLQDGLRIFYTWDGAEGPNEGIVVDLAAGVVSNDGFGDTDTLNLSGPGLLEIRGTDFADSFIGSDRNESFITELGNDTVDGGGGIDGVDYDRLGVGRMDVDLAAGTASGTWYGESFTDSLIRVEYVRGSPDAADLIRGSDANEVLAGSGGDDSLSGLGGDDILYGEDGNDVIAGGDGDDSIDGGAGRDTIGGGLGDDSILGSFGDDVIGAGQGDDLASGSAGNDALSGGAGDDILLGGVGNDTMGASFGNDLLEGGAGDDSLGGGTGQDVLRGKNGADSIGGGEGDDSIEGGEGNDFLAGGGRNDLIDGGAGNDDINGGDGDDTMTGGAGADRFIFNGFRDGDLDVITDFQDGSDIFRMTGVDNDPGTGLAGKLALLGITDTQTGVSMTYEGHVIEVAGISAGDLTLDDFIFL